MDISGWPINKIMQLPEHVFGRRWPVSVAFVLAGAAAKFDMADSKLPDGFVIWGITIIHRWASSSNMEVTLATGEQLPAADVAFNQLPLLFPEIKSANGKLGSIESIYQASNVINRLKVPVVNNGTRLIGRFIRTVGSSVGGQVILTVSSIPNEVPDWLLKP